MKKYVKPELFFESYEVNQNIAACRWDVKNQGNVKDCGAEYDPDLDNAGNGITVFNEAKGCVLTEDQVDESGFCYFNGKDEPGVKQLFNS